MMMMMMTTMTMTMTMTMMVTTDCSGEGSFNNSALVKNERILAATDERLSACFNAVEH